MTPAKRTIMAMMMALKYSIRPCPNGCSRSAGLVESLAPTMVMRLESTSLRLLTASMIIATEPAIAPTAALNVASSTLTTTPTILVRIIFEVLSINMPPVILTGICLLDRGRIRQRQSRDLLQTPFLFQILCNQP